MMPIKGATLVQVKMNVSDSESASNLFVLYPTRIAMSPTGFRHSAMPR